MLQISRRHIGAASGSDPVGILPRSLALEKWNPRPSCGVVCVINVLAILINTGLCSRPVTGIDIQTFDRSIWGARIATTAIQYMTEQNNALLPCSNVYTTNTLGQDIPCHCATKMDNCHNINSDSCTHFTRFSYAWRVVRIVAVPGAGISTLSAACSDFFHGIRPTRMRLTGWNLRA